jgi:RNA polymerase sigma factor (TIGR02999 family)
MSEVTVLLEKVGRGEDPQAQEELLKAVYGELRVIAQAKMAKENPGHTLQPTVLVNDVWLKLFPEGKSSTFNNRGHFFGTAAKVMHRILIDHARARLAKKRGGDLHKTTLSDTGFWELAHPAPDVVMEAVDIILKEIAQEDERAAKVVELRFFVGLTMEETADIMDISLSTAERCWQYFKALFRKKYGDFFSD